MPVSPGFARSLHRLRLAAAAILPSAPVHAPAGRGHAPPAPIGAPAAGAVPGTPARGAAAGVAPGSVAAEPAPQPMRDEVATIERDARRALGPTLGARWELDAGTKQGRLRTRGVRDPGDRHRGARLARAVPGPRINHQSDGRSEPLSRSWNRVIAQAAVERGDRSVLVRPWRGGRRAQARYADRVAGAAPFAAPFAAQRRPVARQRAPRPGVPGVELPRGQVRLFPGYGESLIDHNHRQTTLGSGVSLVEWL
jgi:hypothetical protein